MPFRNEAFDAIFCCYLLELLSAEDIVVRWASSAGSCAIAAI